MSRPKIAAEPSAAELAILRWLVGGGRAATKQQVFEYYQRRAPGFGGELALSRRGVAARVYNRLVDGGFIDPDTAEVTKAGKRAANG